MAGEISDEPMSLLLTVIVPTRNRVSLLAAQLQAIRVILDELIPEQYDVVVGDNSTGEFVSRVVDVVQTMPAHFRIERSEKSLDTAEENLARLIPFARGRFTWLLSDDDGIIRAGAQKLVEQILRDDCDIVVFNSMAVRDERIPGSGPARSERSRRTFYKNDLNCTLKQFLMQTGFFYYITGFSTTLVRTSLLDCNVFKKYLEIGRIYSHVAFLAEIGKSKRFRFINSPLVSFGMVGTDFDGGNAWYAAGIREGGFELSVWTTLWLRQLDELVRQGVFKREEFRFICEMNHEQRFYWPHMLLQQVITQALIPGGRFIPKDECQYILDWLQYLLPEELFALASIRRAFELMESRGKLLVSIPPEKGLRSTLESPDAQKDSDEEVVKLVASLQYWASMSAPRDWFRPFYVRTAHGHDQFHDGLRWFAFPIWNENRRAFLETCDLPSVEPYFIVADSESSLSERCEALGLSAACRLQPPALWLNKPAFEGIIQEPSIQAPQDALVRALDVSTSRLAAEARLHLDAIRNIDSIRAAYGDGDELALARDLPPAVRHSGFSFPEDWGRWTDGGEASIHIPLRPDSDVLSIRFKVAHVFPSLIGKRLTVLVNNRRHSVVIPRGGEAFNVPVKRSERRDGLHVRLLLPATKRPTEEPVADRRALGLGLSGIYLTGRIK